ncbi:MAG: methyltransferase [Anaerolineae bacterium]
MPEKSVTDQRGHRHTLTLGGVEFAIDSHPGIQGIEETLPAIALIAEHASLHTGERVLVGPCGNGLLGAWAARTAGADNVLCLDSNAIALETTRSTLDMNNLPTVVSRADVTREQDGPFDAYLMLLPKGRDLARLWLLNSALATREGGDIYIAGPNSGGIQSFARDAEILLGKGTLLAYRRSNRVFSFHRPGSLGGALPDPFERPGTLNGTYHSYTIPRADRMLTVCTRPGVFSRDGLDEGTQLLLSVLQVQPDDRILDLGCGSGVIGLVAAIEAPAGQVTLIDVDSVAIECSRETLRRNGIEGPAVFHGDGLKAVPGQRYSLIVTNPPFHSGHQVNMASTASFVRDSYDALLPGGRLVMVSNRFLPYDRWLRSRFDHVDVLTSSTRYQVFAASRAHA